MGSIPGWGSSPGGNPLRYFLPGESHGQRSLAESEKRKKMQQEVVEVLEINAKSKKCNPVEAGLYIFKARKLDSGILYSGGILPKKLPEKPATHQKNKTLRSRVYWRINTLCEALPFLHLVRCCVSEKKEIPLTVPRTPAFVRKKRTPKPTQEDEDEEQSVVIRAQ
ncbi:hypothetical protein FD754_021281 [Muntiacus muntjak]|uniref:Uncharacterized protein n=1 Tax=Muntiacus muntjak TaxID=9888 RepID=A0A5N3V5N2_MUNMU|nr:hypothetical protein FD754_021281 [Muntiacus muntjak]